MAGLVGLALDPWQQDVARVVLAKLADGSLASDTVGISIPRQTGKTYTIAAVVFALCLVDPGTTVAWTAHHNKVMLETFKHLRATAQLERLAPHVRAIRASAEDRSIEFRNGSRIVMAARESGALRGVAKVRILVLDEAQILSEDAMSDIMPTQNQAEHPLAIMLGTPPRPKDPGEVFAGVRAQALEAEKMGRAPELLAWIELAADDDAETDDLAQLRKANPSYPKRTPLRAIRKLRRTLSEDNYRREALGIWDDKSTPAVIDSVTWGELEDPFSKAVDRLVLAVDVSPDRSVASVALAGLREDGLAHIELDEQREGVAWVPAWLEDRCSNNPIAAIVIDAKSPAATLLPELKKRKLRTVVTNTEDMTTACALIFDSAMEAQVRHVGQPQLTASLNSARKRSIGDRWAWNRKSADSDITPIVAATLALWGLNSTKVMRRTGERRKGVVWSW